MGEQLKREQPERGKSFPLRGGALRYSGVTKKDGATLGFRRTLTNPETGEKFVRVLDKAHGPGQEFFSKLLARFMPASVAQEMTLKRRILPDKKIYASHVASLKENEAVDSAAITAFGVVIRDIFKDSDRGRPGFLEHNMQSKRVGLFSDKRHVAFYDFEHMPTFFMDQSRILRDDAFYKARSIRYDYRMGPLASTTDILDCKLARETPETQEAIFKLLGKMKELFSGEKGREYVAKIAASIGVPIEKIMHFPKEVLATCEAAGNSSDCLIDAFHAKLTQRIDTGLATAEKLRQKQGIA